MSSWETVRESLVCSNRWEIGLINVPTQKLLNLQAYPSFLSKPFFLGKVWVLIAGPFFLDIFSAPFLVPSEQKRSAGRFLHFHARAANELFFDRLNDLLCTFCVPRDARGAVMAATPRDAPAPGLGSSISVHGAGTFSAGHFSSFVSGSEKWWRTKSEGDRTGLPEQSASTRSEVRLTRSLSLK